MTEKISDYFQTEILVVTQGTYHGFAMARSSALQFQLIQPLVEGLPGDPDGGANAYTLEVPFLD